VTIASSTGPSMRLKSLSYTECSTAEMPTARVHEPRLDRPHPTRTAFGTCQLHVPPKAISSDCVCRSRRFGGPGRFRCGQKPALLDSTPR
jgi:hypothetical protein